MLCRRLCQLSLVEGIQQRALQTSVVDLAKRKGFRIKKDRENKAKAKERRLNAPVKEEWVLPHLRLDKNILKLGSRRFSDKSKQPLPDDNVFFSGDFKEICYKFDEAIALHREVLHPSIMNAPNSLIKARIELNMRLKKKSKHMQPFNSIYLHPHTYDFSRLRRIVAICPDEQTAEQARAEGAILAGGADIIKMLKERTLTELDFDFVVCHTDMLIALADARGVLKDHFPSKQLGNFGSDIIRLIRKFSDGIHYETVRDRYELDYGWVEHHFGRLNMPDEQLKENFVAFLNEIYKYKPTETEHPFITRVLIECPPNDEKFKIDFWNMMKDVRNPEEVDRELSEKEKEKEAKRTKKKVKLSLDDVLAKAAV